MNTFRAKDPWLEERVPGIYYPMLAAAEVDAERYDVSRQAQDEYALSSQQRTAAAQEAGRFDDEIVPLPTTKVVVDKATKETSRQDITLEADEGNRPSTTLESLAGLDPGLDPGVASKVPSARAGKASQLSDGASRSACMASGGASGRGVAPMGMYRGMAVGGCEPEEMGIGPVFAIPKLLKTHGLSIDDIGLWELNEACAVQTLDGRDRLGIDPATYNVDGGGIS